MFIHAAKSGHLAAAGSDSWEESTPVRAAPTTPPGAERVSYRGVLFLCLDKIMERMVMPIIYPALNIYNIYIYKI